MEPDGIPATSGACPICGELFDDVDAYSAHLADEHDLHDDDGAPSSFGTLVAAPAIPIAAMAEGGPVEGPPPRAAGPGDRGRPWGLVLLVLALIGMLAGLVAFGPGRDDGDDEVAQVTDATSTSDGPGQGSATTSTPSPTAGGPSTTADGDRGSPSTSTAGSPSSSTSVTSGAGGSSSPRPTTTSTIPTTTTTATTAPPSFSAPTTSGARIDSCARLKNRLRITYSWRFDGGTGWHAPSGYTATGGGRYQDVVDVPRHGTTTITTVQALDASGGSHSVALQPALQSSAC